MVITQSSIFCGDDFFSCLNTNCEFKDFPPLIGCVISDKDGKSLISFEVFNGAITHFLSDIRNMTEKEKFLEIDLIPMYVSAIETFSRELNVKDLPGIEIGGSNVKIYINFTFNQFTVTLFLNPIVKSKIINDMIVSYLENLFEEYHDDLLNITRISSKDFRCSLERIGWNILLNLNNEYLIHL